MTSTDDHDTGLAAMFDRHWPAAGPHTAETVITAVDAAARLLRYANIATTDTYLTVPEISAVVDALKVLVRRAPQLCEQLGRALAEHADHTPMSHLGGSDPAGTTRTAAARLRGHTGGLTESLNRAATALELVAADTVNLGHL